IGQGANGKVYRLDPDTIIKVYLNPDSLSDIHRERELARTAFVAGIPTAIPYDVVKVGEGYGSVFELLSAKSFAKLIAAEPDNLDKYVALYVDLLKKIHSTIINSGNIPNQKEVTLDWVKFLKEYLPQSTYDKLYKLVDAIPESKYLMHGDYHIKNVMMQGDEVLLIDMDTLCLGNPVFEFASIFLAYVGFSELDHDNVIKFLGIPFEVSGQIWKKTLEMYFDTTDEATLDDIANKAKIIGYTRLMRRTIRRDPDSEIGKKTIELAKNNIIELVEKVDSLVF
ncbi:MAG: phosphotransferase, partial [Clostridia bacterium]|nr:phosphotransferase [Clostridia bacterium]